jgi:small subunit ribosomal protein S9
VEDYFPGMLTAQNVRAPLDVTNNTGKFDIFITVRGGGVSSQIEACRHGIARALNTYDATNHTALRANGFLTRDPRMVERKKYGQAGARRRFQFSKR